MKSRYDHHESNLQLVVLLAIFFFVLALGIVTTSIGFSLDSLTKAQSPTNSFEFAGGLKVLGALPTGGSLNPSDVAYCLEDEDPDGCADGSAFIIPKGVTGKSGSCGTIISQAHLIIPSLQRNKKTVLDSLNYELKNCDYTTGTYTIGYLPTYFVIDAYNLAGFKDLSKSNPLHVSGKSLQEWWRDNPEGYKYIPYSTSAIYQHAYGQQDLTGCAVFLATQSGVHLGIFNSLQLVNENGDGLLSILQAGVKYPIERYEVTSWKVKNLSFNANETNSLLGFGCRR